MHVCLCVCVYIQIYIIYIYECIYIPYFKSTLRHFVLIYFRTRDKQNLYISTIFFIKEGILL